MRDPMWAAVLRRQGEQCGRPLLEDVGLVTELMEDAHHKSGIGKTEGVLQLLRQAYGIVTLRQGSIRVPQKPRGNRPIDETDHPRVMAVEKGVGVVLLRLIEAPSSCQV